MASAFYIGSGAEIRALAKAALLHVVLQATLHSWAELSKVPGIYVLGSPKVNVVSVASKDFDIFRVFERVVECGWNVNGLQFPSSFHLCVTVLHTQDEVAERFVRDVHTAVEQVSKDRSSKCSGVGAMYGMAQAIPDRSIINELAEGYIDVLYKC